MESDSWQLQHDGELSGPHDDAAILGMIAAGMHNALIRRGEHDAWQPLVSHPPFADALRWAPPRHDTATSQSDHLGWVLVALPCIVAPVVLLVPEADRFASYGMIIACAALVAWDCKRWKIYPSARWVVGTLMLWLVAYPLYLHERGKRGATKLLVPGLCAAGLFMGASLVGLFAEVYVECTVLAVGDAECTLSNHGIMPGRACFRVELIRNDDGEMRRSPELCRTLWPRSEERETFPNVIADPVTHCGGDEASWAEVCNVQITFPEQ
jgi:hypothetical protein